MKKFYINAKIPSFHDLLLPDGLYGKIHLKNIKDENLKDILSIYFIFEFDQIIEPDPFILKEKNRRIYIEEAEQMIDNLNRLIRWYKATNGVYLNELTYSQINDIKVFEPLTTISSNNPIFQTTDREIYQINFNQNSPSTHVNSQNMAQKIKSGLKSGQEPPSETLLLLDAKHAKKIGNFRGSVLFCWSLIDNIFKRDYQIILNRSTNENMKKIINNLTLQQKMSMGLKIIVNSSLFDDSIKWDNLSKSYSKRNAIIHEAENAIEKEADEAINAANYVIDFMKNLINNP